MLQIYELLKKLLINDNCVENTKTLILWEYGELNPHDEPKMCR